MTNQDTTTTCTYVNESANAHPVFFFQKPYLRKTAVWENLKVSQGRKKKVIFCLIKIKWKWDKIKRTCLRLYKVSWI